MATQEFSKLYYRTSNCLTSDIIADFAPVSRVLGVDCLLYTSRCV